MKITNNLEFPSYGPEEYAADLMNAETHEELNDIIMSYKGELAVNVDSPRTSGGWQTFVSIYEDTKIVKYLGCGFRECDKVLDWTDYS